MKIFKNENERYNFFLLSGALMIVFVTLFSFVFFNINAHKTFIKRTGEHVNPGW